MLGWITDCVAKLVMEKYGHDAWCTIRDQLTCAHVQEDGFLKLEYYDDQDLMDMIELVCRYSGMTMEEALEVSGEYFVQYVHDIGFKNLLYVQGNTFCEFLKNVNAIHEHLSSSFQTTMRMPEFWVEEKQQQQQLPEQEEINNNNTKVIVERQLVLHYVSQRGNFLAPLAKGIVVASAKTIFDIDLVMTRTATQGVDGSKCTSWILTTQDEQDMYRLYATKMGRRSTIQNMPPSSSSAASTVSSFKCPFSSGHNKIYGTSTTSSVASTKQTTIGDDPSASSGCPYHHQSSSLLLQVSKEPPAPSLQGTTDPSTETTAHSSSASSEAKEPDDNDDGDYEPPLNRNLDHHPSSTSSSASLHHHANTATTTTTPDLMQLGAAVHTLFPYHVVLTPDFRIHSTGDSLAQVLDVLDVQQDLLQRPVHEVLQIVKPAAAEWTTHWMHQMTHGQHLVTESLLLPTHDRPVRFKGTVVRLPGDDTAVAAAAWLIPLSPEVESIDELHEMGLTLSDIPVHGSYRETVALKEHLRSHMNHSLEQEKYSLQSLRQERDLLETLLPQHAAEGLRKGQSVDPRYHTDATIFFSDVVGFTQLCHQMQPWDVISMLNRLYYVMDLLAAEFHLFKIETIGDAYVCASGLPHADPRHAKNVANFAIAVSHCAQQHIRDPLTQRPIQLRIGIHSGPCASGVVGVTNPRYCVFGDTVNTAARHESTGSPGRIHCSATTAAALRHQAPDRYFVTTDRGLVDMKGKGQLQTYWLQAGKRNSRVNGAGLKHLDKYIQTQLEQVEREKLTGVMPSLSSDDTNNLAASKRHRDSLLSLNSAELDLIDANEGGGDHLCHSLRSVSTSTGDALFFM